MEAGDQPKRVKGPDVFLDVIERVSKERKIFVFLSAPARGFVKRGLERLGVPYLHVVLKDYLEIPSLYHALDMYLITSREEGGPKGILESLAVGIPLVSTKVGMAIDMIADGVNGLVANNEDVDGLVTRVSSLATDAELRSRLAANGKKTIAEYDWAKIAARYFTEIYKPILDSAGK
jgi:glycosyltransferase involved in cell wall biosynthesis